MVCKGLALLDSLARQRSTKKGGSTSANPSKRYENQQYASQHDCSGNRVSVYRFQLGVRGRSQFKSISRLKLGL
jgi:hypothetical protein